MVNKTLLLAGLTGGSLYFAHDYAHQIYGVSEGTIGSVGLSISALAVVGFYLNRAAFAGEMMDMDD